MDGLPLKILSTTTALLGFFLLLQGDKRRLFWSGFFIGLLWFYWIGFSFRYYDATLFIPLMMLFVSLGYGLFFWVIGMFQSPFMRALLFAAFSYFHPMNFNWFIPELTLIDSFIGIQKWQFLLFLFGIAALIALKQKFKLLGLMLIIASINFTGYETLDVSDKNIYMATSNVRQDLKWQPEYLQTAVQDNFNIIYDAINKEYEMLILSESTFPTFLNTEPYLMEKLKTLSKEITIVAGGLYSDGKSPYNSTYYFIDGEVQIAHKVILVPFGEEIPLPQFLNRIINDMFYNGAEDYKTADKPTDIEIKGESFRNAICYEATREELFVGNPKFMIAMSNNAWFTPSIEPTLQYQLLRYFSQKHGTTIYHVANASQSALIH